MNYYNIVTKKVLTLDEIIKENPLSCIPKGADLTSLNYFPIVESDEPSYDSITQGLRFEIVKNEANEYKRIWHIYQLPIEQIEKNIIEKNNTLKNNIISFTETTLDNFAKERGYDDIRSACSYYGSPVEKYANDAIIALDIRSRTWEALYKLLEDVENGIVEIPTTIEEVMAILPKAEWS